MDLFLFFEVRHERAAHVVVNVGHQDRPLQGRKRQPLRRAQLIVGVGHIIGLVPTVHETVEYPDEEREIFADAIGVVAQCGDAHGRFGARGDVSDRNWRAVSEWRAYHGRPP
jgi:hypothetical protein